MPFVTGTETCSLSLDSILRFLVSCSLKTQRLFLISSRGQPCIAFAPRLEV
jgi:hypothetical protein